MVEVTDSENQEERRLLLHIVSRVYIHPAYIQKAKIPLDPLLARPCPMVMANEQVQQSHQDRTTEVQTHRNQSVGYSAWGTEGKRNIEWGERKGNY